MVWGRNVPDSLNEASSGFMAQGITINHTPACVIEKSDTCAVEQSRAPNDLYGSRLWSCLPYSIRVHSNTSFGRTFLVPSNTLI